MTRDETKKIIAVIVATYPNWHPQDLSFTVDAWNSILNEFSYEQIAAALKAFILSDTSGFAPSVGQLVGMIEKVKGQSELNEMEAWALVSKAIRRSGYNSAEEFLKLPEEIQKSVGSASQLHAWAIDTDYNEAVVSSNFMRSYRGIISRKKELSAIPASVRAVIENTSKAMIGCEEK